MFTNVFHLLACIKIIQGLTSTLNRLGIKKKYQKVDVLMEHKLLKLNNMIMNILINFLINFIYD